MSLISVSDLTFGYEGSFDTIFEHVNLQLDTDWRLGLIGRNGRGKTTLLRLLMGELEYRGTISAPVEFAYFPYAVKDDNLTAETVVRSICPQVQLWELQRELSLLDRRRGAGTSFLHPVRRTEDQGAAGCAVPGRKPVSAY